MRIKGRVVSLSLAMAVAGMLAMGSGEKVYASEGAVAEETIATSTDAIEDCEGEAVQETEEVIGEVLEEVEAEAETETSAEVITEGVEEPEALMADVLDIEDAEELLPEEEDSPAGKHLTVYNGVDYSLVYDYQYYISKYPDIKKAFNGDEEATLKHFVEYGMGEGRRGNDSFELSSYRNAYADLRKAFGTDNSLYYKHYVLYGSKENRTTKGVTTVKNPIAVLNGKDYSSVYNYDYYINRYPDLMKAFGNNDIAALKHFVDYGMSEMRHGNEAFDINSYYLTYQDLRVSFNRDWKSYYDHYMKYGKKEHRKTTGETELQNPVSSYRKVDYSSVYDYYYYIRRYPALKKVYGQDDIALMSHFVHYGMNEGRQGTGTYKASDYINLKKKSNEFIEEEDEVLKAKKKAEEEAKKRAADPKAAETLDKIGWTLAAAYKYASSQIEYEGKLVYTESWGSYKLAQQGFNNGTGNCYVMAAVFYEMAKMMGYEVYQMAGYIPLVNGGETPHSWCEVVQDGNIYLCDPNLTYHRGNDAYMKPYGTKGTWKYQHYHRMN